MKGKYQNHELKVNLLFIYFLYPLLMLNDIKRIKQVILTIFNENNQKIWRHFLDIFYPLSFELLRVK